MKKETDDKYSAVETKMRNTIAKKNADISSTRQRWKGKMDCAIKSKEDRLMNENNKWQDKMVTTEQRKESEKNKMVEQLTKEKDREFIKAARVHNKNQSALLRHMQEKHDKKHQEIKAAHREEVRSLNVIAVQARLDAEKFMLQNRMLKRQFESQYSAKEKQRHEKAQTARLRYGTHISRRDAKIKELEELVVQMRDMMFELTDEIDEDKEKAKVEVKEAEKLVAHAVHCASVAQRRENRTRDKYQDWKQRHDEAVDAFRNEQVASKKMSGEVEELSGEIEELQNLVENMRCQYEDAINDLTPTTIRKVWVKNVEAKGKQPITLVIYLSSNTHNIPFYSLQVDTWSGYPR